MNATLVSCAPRAAILPRALRAGDRIAVVAASGNVDRDRLRAGVAVLESRNFEVCPPVPRRADRCMAATDVERREDLLGALADASVRAVWCARGGYGMVRLLPDLDPAWLARNAKLVIGYSDATALLARLVHGAGVAAIHGPMVAGDLAAQEASGALDHLLAIAAGDATWRLPVPRTIAAGEAAAPLLGGCLTVVASLAGTPFAPSFACRIAFFEDVAERPQRRIDRMLVQLRQSGMLDGVRAILFGTMVDCGEPDEICATIADVLGDLGVPIGYGAPIGHVAPNFAVPLGVSVRLCLGDAASIRSARGGGDGSGGDRSAAAGNLVAGSTGFLEGVEPVVS